MRCYNSAPDSSRATQQVRTFSWPIRVYYEDTDSGGVVYYANYLKYMERARTEWLRSLGYEQDRLLGERRRLFVVRALQLDYLRPAHFNEQLEVCTRVRDWRRVGLTFDQWVQREPGRILCAGTVEVACVDADRFRPRSLPAALLTEIRSGS